MKHLQKEVARLEAELRTPEPTNSDAILMEKDRRIKQVWPIIMFEFIFS